MRTKLDSVCVDRFDDERVTKLSEQSGGDEYLIFYDKDRCN